MANRERRRSALPAKLTDKAKQTAREKRTSDGHLADEARSNRAARAKSVWRHTHSIDQPSRFRRQGPSGSARKGKETCRTRTHGDHPALAALIRLLDFVDGLAQVAQQVVDHGDRQARARNVQRRRVLERVDCT